MSKQSREQSRTQRAAAIRAEQARKERNRRVALIVGIVVLLGAIVAAGAWYGGGGGNDSSGDSKTPTLVASDTSLNMGDPKAAVKIVVYEDFLCPFCRELEASTRDYLKENADKGKVYVEYRPINLLREYAYSAKALNAWAAVLKHGTPAEALKLHNILFDNQPYEQASGQVTDAQIADWVKAAAGDNSDVADAMKTQDTAFFDATRREMADAKVTSTPTVFVNGQELPPTSVTDMVTKLETAVQQANK